jgi:alkylresorcinol/alkylpyrone synthase
MLLADASTMQGALRRTTADFDVVIASVATAVPPHKVSQATAAEMAMRVFPHLSGLAGLFANTGIESRYVCETPDWYLEDRGWEERTASFQRHALVLLEEVALKAWRPPASNFTISAQSLSIRSLA